MTRCDPSSEARKLGGSKTSGVRADRHGARRGRRASRQARGKHSYHCERPRRRCHPLARRCATPAPLPRREGRPRLHCSLMPCGSKVIRSSARRGRPSEEKRGDAAAGAGTYRTANAASDSPHGTPSPRSCFSPHGKGSLSPRTRGAARGRLHVARSPTSDSVSTSTAPSLQSIAITSAVRSRRPAP